MKRIYHTLGEWQYNVNPGLYPQVVHAGKLPSGRNKGIADLFDERDWESC